MKKYARMVSTFLAVLILLTMFVACTREIVNSGDGPVNANVTQLNISNYEGGYGREWLDKAAKRFEERYKDYSFEEDKKGVKVNIFSSINGTAGSSFVSGLKANTSDVIFTEDVFYYDLIAKEGAVDISDIVTADLTEWDEEKTIEDKLDRSLIDFFKTSEGKYYALPHYEAFYGIVYDLDLFRLRSLYFAKGGTPGEYSAFVQENNSNAPTGSFTTYKYTNGSNKNNLSSGPDGIYGTYDDGLPATYEEHFTLCNYMVSNGIIPYTWAGGLPGDSTSTLYQLWADYEGKDNFLMNFTLQGEASDLIEKISGNNVAGATLMPQTTITPANSNLLQRQLGKYYATDFARNIGRNSRYATDLSYSPSESNVTSEGTYLLSRLDASKTPIAFHMNGVWWESEADMAGYFDSYSLYGETRSTRKFAMMPMPKVSNEYIGTKRTIATNTNLSLCFINSRIENNAVKLEVAKKFVQFVHTDIEMQYFSVETSANKPFNYNIPESMLENMSYFGRDIASMKNNPNIDIVYTLSNNISFINNFSKFHPTEIDWKNNRYSRNIIKEFKDKTNLTIEDFFNALVESRPSNWLN